MKKIIQYLIGLNLMAIGVALYLKTDIGIGSWDVLHSNLIEFYPFKIGAYQFTFGTWVFIVGIITILFSQFFHLNIRSLLAIITGLILGQFIDLWHIYILGFELSSLYIRVPLFFLSLLSLGSGISLLVLSTLPPTPPDILMIGLMKRFDVNFLVAKSLTEATIFIVAIVIGTINGIPFNNIGIGTLLTLLLIGSIVHQSSKIWKKLFSI